MQDWAWPVTAASQYDTEMQHNYEQRSVGGSGHTEPLFWSLHLWPELHLLRQYIHLWKCLEEIC